MRRGVDSGPEVRWRFGVRDCGGGGGGKVVAKGGGGGGGRGGGKGGGGGGGRRKRERSGEGKGGTGGRSSTESSRSSVRSTMKSYKETSGDSPATAAPAGMSALGMTRNGTLAGGERTYVGTKLRPVKKDPPLHTGRELPRACKSLQELVRALDHLNQRGATQVDPVWRVCKAARDLCICARGRF